MMECLFLYVSLIFKEGGVIYGLDIAIMMLVREYYLPVPDMYTATFICK